MGWSTGFMATPRTWGGRPDVRVGAGAHGVSRAQAVGRQDVALLAVGVVQQRDVRGAVGVVLDARHPRGDPELLAPEVDGPEAPLVTAAPVAPGLVPGLVGASPRQLAPRQ